MEFSLLKSEKYIPCYLVISLLGIHPIDMVSWECKNKIEHGHYNIVSNSKNLGTAYVSVDKWIVQWMKG